MDFLSSLRSLRKSPALAGAAIAILALSIGATAAVFSIVQAILLRPLPFPDSAKIVVPATIFSRSNSDRGSVSYPDLLDWKGQSQLFTGVAAYNLPNINLTGGDQPERVRAAVVGEDYFKVFTTPPLIGRVFTAGENIAPANRVVILSHGLWMRRYGGDPNVLAQPIELNGLPHNIVGVLPKGAQWPQEAELLRPMGYGPNPPQMVMRRDNHIFQAVARLRPDVTIEQAQQALNVMAKRVEMENPVTRKGTGWKLHPIDHWIIGPELRRSIFVLAAAVGFVLAIGCVNLANLLLARGTSRRREFAIRTALGAGRLRLIGQQLGETLMLSLAGGVLGLAVAWWGVRGLKLFGPADTPRLADASLDLTAVAFTFAVSLVTALIIGLLPALQSANSDPVESLREGSRSVTGGMRGTRMRNALVAGELALSVILLVGACLLIRTFYNLQHINPGFDTARLLTFEIGLPQSRYGAAGRSAAAYQQITDSIRAIPGVTAAASAGALPLDAGGFYLGRAFLVEGRPEPPAGKEAGAAWDVVQPAWFQTMGIPIVQGRAFQEQDTKAAAQVMIISESMAKELFPGESPLGQRVRSWRDENVYREVVGVARDVPYYELTQQRPNVVYVPHAQDSWMGQVISVRTQGDPSLAMAAIRSSIRNFDRNLPINEVQTMDQALQRATARPRFLMSLLMLFAVAALLLGAIGIYGVISFTVGQRLHEIGIRIALGAQRADILRDVLGRGMVLIAVGVALGLAGAFALTRLMSGLLFGVTARDPLAFAGGALFLIAVALAASWLPARRASQVDPIQTLRYE